MTPDEALCHDWILEGLPPKVLQHHKRIHGMAEVSAVGNLPSSRKAPSNSLPQSKEKKKDELEKSYGSNTLRQSLADSQNQLTFSQPPQTKHTKINFMPSLNPEDLIHSEPQTSQPLTSNIKKIKVFQQSIHEEPKMQRKKSNVLNIYASQVKEPGKSIIHNS